jgi:hypothetical protein
MRRLDLDLARSHRALGGWPLPAVLLAALLLVAGAGLAVQATLRWLALQDDVAQLQQRAARQRARMPAPADANVSRSAAATPTSPPATSGAMTAATSKATSPAKAATTAASTSAASPAARPAATQLAQRGPAIDEETRRELDNARQILTHLALPWEPLFGAIEAALTRDTALLAIEPDAAKGLVRLSGEARNYPAILVLMRRLEQPVAGHGVVLSGVHLLSHDVRDDVPERPLRYTVSARWSTGP